LEVSSVTWASGYDINSISPVWAIASAPSTSVYYPYDTNVLVSTNVTYNETMIYLNASSWINSTSTTVVSYYERNTRTFTLGLSTDRSNSIFPTCFRPDVGGDYAIKLFLTLANTVCTVSSTATVSTVCSSYAPVLDLVPSTIPAVVARFKPSRVWLNASSVTDGDNSFDQLLFFWEVVYPNIDSYNPIDGSSYTIPQDYEPQAAVTSFVAQANINYVFKLSVSDRCHTTTKIITITTTCDIDIPLDNRTLVASYDGSIPIPLMSFGYDHTKEIAGYLPAPRCQKYTWTFVDYSVGYSESLFSSNTDFVKTSGFAGLITAVVIVAVIVPVIVWLYCTKKACFKSTDPRV